jgi:WD40 repeat protein
MVINSVETPQYLIESFEVLCCWIINFSICDKLKLIETIHPLYKQIWSFSFTKNKDRISDFFKKYRPLFIATKVKTNNKSVKKIIIPKQSFIKAKSIIENFWFCLIKEKYYRNSKTEQLYATIEKFIKISVQYYIFNILKRNLRHEIWKESINLAKGIVSKRFSTLNLKKTFLKDNRFWTTKNITHAHANKPILNKNYVINAKRYQYYKRIRTNISFSTFDRDWDLSMLEEIRQQQNLNQEHLPSCCLYTFAFDNHALNCVEIGYDASYVYGGFDDSSIRLYSFLHGTSPLNVSSRARREKADTIETKNCVLLRAHTGPIYSIKLSFDGQSMFSSSADGSVKLWSTELRSNISSYKVSQAPVWDISLSPRGHYFITGSADHTAKLWTTQREKPLRTYLGHKSDVECVIWHPNCQYFFTGSNDHSVRQWDVASGKCVRVFLGLCSPITSLAVCPDGKSIVAGSQEGFIMSWDLGKATLLGKSRGHKAPVWSLKFAHNTTSILASGGGDSIVKIWSYLSSSSTSYNKPTKIKSCSSLNTSQLGLLATWMTKHTPVYSLRFTPKNLLIGAGALRVKKTLV